MTSSGNTPVVTMAIPAQTARERESDAWTGLGLLLLALIAAAIFARVRFLRLVERAQPRLLRIFYTAAGVAGAFTFWLVAEQLLRARMEDDLLPLAIVTMTVFIVIGMILFGIADFWLGLWQPCRTRRWLIVALLVFVALILALTAIAVWIQDSRASFLLPEILQMLAVGAIAGTFWWSYLPASRADVAPRFD